MQKHFANLLPGFLPLLILSAACMPVSLCAEKTASAGPKRKSAEKEFQLGKNTHTSREDRLKHLNLAIQLDPTYEAPLKERGDYFFHTTNLPKAIEDYTQVLTINPKSIHARSHRATCYARQGKLQLALQDFTREIETEPTLANAYENRARIYHRLGRLDLEKKDLDTAMSVSLEKRAINHETPAQQRIDQLNADIRKHPTDRILYFWRAQKLRKLGNYTAAIEDFTKVLTLPSKKTKHITMLDLEQVYFERAACHEKLSLFAKAIADYDKLLELDVNSEEAYLYRGDCNFKLGRVEKAVCDYTQAINNDRDQLAKPFLARAKAYEKLGKKDLAQRDYQRAKEQQ